MEAILPTLEAHDIPIESDGVVEVRPGVLAFFIKDRRATSSRFATNPEIATYRPDLFPPQGSAS